MDRDSFRTLIKSVPDAKEDGNVILFDGGWDVSIYSGKMGPPIPLSSVSRVTLEAGFLHAETTKGQHVFVVYDEIRGISADPASDVKRGGRRPGFV